MAVRPYINLRFAHRSDRGAARRINEDTSAVEEMLLGDGRPVVVAAVADGIAGARAGHEASQIAVASAFNCIREALQRRHLRDGAQWQQLLVEAIAFANTAVNHRREVMRRGSMGTTLMLTVVVGRRAFIAHIGDCRAYAIRPAVRKPHITQLTVEHTVVAELVGQGALSYAEANGHPQRHQLARAIGSHAEVEPELAARTLRPNERLLPCSDGLPPHLSDIYLAPVVSDASTPQQACDQLIALANERGGRDNLSAVVIAADPLPSATTSQLQPS